MIFGLHRMLKASCKVQLTMLTEGYFSTFRVSDWINDPDATKRELKTLFCLVHTLMVLQITNSRKTGDIWWPCSLVMETHVQLNYDETRCSWVIFVLCCFSTARICLMDCGNPEVVKIHLGGIRNNNYWCKQKTRCVKCIWFIKPKGRLIVCIHP